MKSPCVVRTLIAGLCLLAAGARALSPGDTGTTIHPPRFAADDLHIEVDGRLDEPVWSQIPAYDDFFVIEPDTMARPQQPTRVQFAYTNEGLYVGVTSIQDPKTLVSRLSARDGHVNRDSVSLTIDPTGKGLYGYWFQVALGDSLTDGTVVPEREFTTQWDGPWRGDSAQTKDGWTAEFFLPWSMMSMPAAGPDRTIAFYISRKVAYLDERWAMPALPKTRPRFMSVLRPIALADVTPKRQLTFYPFSAVTWDAHEGDLESRVGADLYWRPNSNLQLSATANPDFGTIEQDDLKVNLSAYEDFFSEKRQFFLEGQEVFVSSPRAAGNYDGGPPVLLVNTRRVGASPYLPDRADIDHYSEEDQIRLSDLYGAGKVTGQIGQVRYGVLSALERDTEVTGIDLAGNRVDFDVQGRRFGALRALWESGAGAGYRGLGSTVTLVGQPGADGTVAAVDGHLLTADGHWKVDAQAMASDADHRKGFGLISDIVYTPRQGRTHSLGIELYDDEFDINDFGFLRRNDQALFDYRWQIRRSDLDSVREETTTFHWRQGWNLDGKMISSGLFLDREWTFHNLSKFWANIGLRPKRWDDRNSRGNGAFRVDTRGVLEMEWRSNDSLELSGGVEGGLRHEDLQGLSFDGRLFLTWRPTNRFSADLSLRYRHRSGWLLYQDDHPALRDFTTFNAIEWRPAFTLDYFFTARQQLRATLQWVAVKAREEDLLKIGPDGDLVDRARLPGQASDDFAISNMVFQLRYRWELAPLSDLFVVYSRGGSLDDPSGRGFNDMLTRNFDNPDRNQLVAKLRYRLGS